jgi:hypothetical protein
MDQLLTDLRALNVSGQQRLLFAIVAQQQQPQPQQQQQPQQTTMWVAMDVDDDDPSLPEHIRQLRRSARLAAKPPVNYKS